MGLTPSIRLFQSTTTKWRKVLVNSMSAEHSTYIVPNSSIIQKTFFDAYIPVDVDIVSLRSIGILNSKFFKKFLYVRKLDRPIVADKFKDYVIRKRR